MTGPIVLSREKSLISSRLCTLREIVLEFIP